MDLFPSPSLAHVDRMSESSLLTDRTRLHRRASRGTHEPEVVHAILDEALICHLAFVGRAGPMVIPTSFVRIADKIYIHGSSANGMLRTLSEGVEACACATLMDGLVLGRTAMHHSMNYRSVVLFGRASVVDDVAEKHRAFAALLEKMVPRRSTECRMPNEVETNATLVLSLPITEASAKIRSGPPIADDPEDQDLPYWAGVIPLALAKGTPIRAT
jgi:nitroimidazol reductase NimA-like FMN-containing flavoprotein (pyridoxamine 5'-phosphate oxidase superfamily)